MNVLSLDLSTKASGWCIGTKDSVESYGCITSKAASPIERIKEMRDGIAALLEQHNIDYVVMEEVRTDFNNAHVYKLLTWLQGVITLAIYEYNPRITIQYMQASSWRSRVGIKTGRGVKRAEVKKADIEYVNNRYGLVIESDDIADAIGIKDGFFASL